MKSFIWVRNNYELKIILKICEKHNPQGPRGKRFAVHFQRLTGADFIHQFGETLEENPRIKWLRITRVQ